MKSFAAGLASMIVLALITGAVLDRASQPTVQQSLSL